MLLIGVKILALAAAVLEIVFAPAALVLAFGVVATVFVLVTVLVDLFAGGIGPARRRRECRGGEAGRQPRDETAPGQASGDTAGQHVDS